MGFPDAGLVAHLLKELMPGGLHLWEGQEALRAQSRAALGGRGCTEGLHHRAELVRRGLAQGLPTQRGQRSGSPEAPGLTTRCPCMQWASCERWRGCPTPERACPLQGQRLGAPMPPDPRESPSPPGTEAGCPRHLPTPERARLLQGWRLGAPTPPHPKPTSLGHSWAPLKGASGVGGWSVAPPAALPPQAPPAGLQAQAEPPALPPPHPSQLRAARPGYVSTLHRQNPSGPSLACAQRRACARSLCFPLSKNPSVQKHFSPPKKPIIPNIPQV